MMSAEGPRTLRIAGEIADQAMIHTGLTPEILEDTIAHVRAGEWNAGKPLGSTEIRAFAKCNIADDHDAAIDEIKMALAASAHHAFRFTHVEGNNVQRRPRPGPWHASNELHEAMMAIQGEYVPAEHEQVGHTYRNAAISDEFGVTDYLADRFAVVGTPEECRAKSYRRSHRPAWTCCKSRP